jgi:hypothetical protein
LHYLKVALALRKCNLNCPRRVLPTETNLHQEAQVALDLEGNIAAIVPLLIPIVGSIALFSFLAVASWSEARRKEREAYYRSETLKKIAESSGEGARIAMELMREEQQPTAKRSLEGMKLGGLVTAAVGIGVMVLLRGIVQDEGPVYLVGVIPLLIGVALLVYVFLLAPKQVE